MAALAVLLFLTAVAPSSAQETEADSSSPEAPDSASAPPDAGAESPGEADTEAEPDPCESIVLVGEAWIDWWRNRVHRSVCESALWFDQLFGGRTAYEERDQNYGYWRLGVRWDEREGADLLSRGRASFHLPRMENRLRAIVGREDRDELISDYPDGADRAAPFFGDPDDDEWLVGLGYGRARGTRDRWDAGVGANIATPIEPWVRVSYRHYHLYSPERLGRLRQTVFWRDEEGAGTTTRYDLERILGDTRLIRWRNAATWAEGSKGVRWSTGASLYQRIGTKRAVAFETVVRGETDHEVPHREVRFRVIYRQSLSREWLFLDVRPAIAYRRGDLAEERDWVPALSVGIEMQFGER